MSIDNAAKFFDDNIKHYVNHSADPALSNLNKGLLMLVNELHREIRHLHAEIAHISQQVGQIPIR